ncbi:MAG: alpha-mannosidase [Verrucomicrobia bacterium]|nr:alpha-mannosidase [Verrucomicrobiota bacterium]
MRKCVVHLVCNAHLDPVWLWEWEEGACEALSTFRTAADLCEEFDGFIFNHNEAILYKWVEEYEPELFKRIQRLVKAGKWHIMGGWYLQPDCNMPSGEGFVRQILTGREYFEKKFGARPTTAINFDPFGHTRGLVQILVKSGYDSYVHCRPLRSECGQEADDYIWVGYDGSEIICTRPRLWYNSPLGGAGGKLNLQLEEDPAVGVSLMLWGVGNHGGGPSRKDIRDINRIIAREKKRTVLHSTPEAYFNDLKLRRDELVRWPRDLNPWAVGCYSSMIRIKQGYRALENALFMAEKMASTAAAQNLMPYPGAELKAAQEDLLWTAFHDVLPGSSTPPVEEHALQKIGHGMEMLSRIRARAFFCLAGGLAKAKPETYPVFVFNPHPWEIETTITAEFNLPDMGSRPETFWVPKLLQKGKEIPIQAERPYSNIPIDWRKRVCFRAALAPGSVSRFDVTLVRKSKRPAIKDREKDGVIRFRGESVDWAINTRSGLVEHLRFRKRDVLRRGAFKVLVMRDTADPWGTTTDTFDTVLGSFRLLSQTKSAQVSGVARKRLKPVRIVEDGPVRTVVEALYGYNDSLLILTWRLPKVGAEIEIEARVLWNEKDRMLKLSIPTVLQEAAYVGDVAYGRDVLPATGREVVAQKWTAVVSERDGLALTVVNDGIYASSCADGEMRITLLRSPAYSALPVNDWATVPDDMFRPRIDQGERVFRFWMNAGQVDERMEEVARDAQIHNEKPMTQWFSPSGQGSRPKPFAVLSNRKVQITTIKQAESGGGWIIRLFEPTGRPQKTQLRIAVDQPFRTNLTLRPFEIKTLEIDIASRSVIETNLMEETGR